MIQRKSTGVLILTLMMLVLVGCSSEKTEIKNPVPSSSSTIEPIDFEPSLSSIKSISHAHGLAVDASDSNKLYIATHNGLLVLKNGKDLYQIGDVQDDFMGFSAHPNESNTFFTSGHAKRGGNIGIQKSDDGGMSWEKLSNGVSGPVDFHSMALSPVNANLLYGWYGGLQRSDNGGKNWEPLTTSLQNVISLTADPHDENTLYAATANGLQVSRDQGETWSVFSESLSSGVVTAVAIDPADKQNMLSFSEALGLVRSDDGGSSWESIQNDLGIVLYFAFDTNKAGTVYALNKENVIHRSVDAGQIWELVK